MQYTFLDFLKLIGSMGMFLYGMKIMSEGLQKAAGEKLRNILTAMTTNRFTGVLTGILITALIQSSSATTVMVVSFVNAKLLTLAQSISVIMGANIGTTVTAWVISIFGFKVDMGAFALPLLAFALPLIFSKKSQRKSIGEFIFGFAFLFMGLSFLKVNAPDLNNNPEMLAFVQHYTGMGYISIFIFLFIGTLLTIIVQSSSATMAITLIMCANGWISLELGAAFVLGENIGTTITANFAALTGNAQAKRAALAHFVFNILGVIWVLILFYPFIHFINWVVDTYFASNIPAVVTSYKLSAFHTIFNICNVLLLIPAVSLIEKAVCFLIPADEEDEDYRLRYISAGILSTAELSILQARKEIQLFSDRSVRMFDMVQNILTIQKDEDFCKLFGRIKKYENISDNMEVEIANYLGKVATGRLSSDSKRQIQAMLREITELESICDSCYNLARTIDRKRQTEDNFTEEQEKNIKEMMKLVESALLNMKTAMNKEERSLSEINKNYTIENEINKYRDTLKTKNIIDINNKEYDYQRGVYYMDIIAECEKLGDYVVNVVETGKPLM